MRPQIVLRLESILIWRSNDYDSQAPSMKTRYTLYYTQRDARRRAMLSISQDSPLIRDRNSGISFVPRGKAAGYVLALPSIPLVYFEDAFKKHRL